MQIGPRIRIGGSVGKVGQKLKIGAGKVLSKSAPLVSFINPAWGAAAGAVGDALDTTDGRFDIGRAAMNAGKSYGMGKIGGKVLKKIPGVDKLAGKTPGVSSIAGGLRNKIPGGDQIGNALEAMQSVDGPLSLGGEEPGRFRRLGDFLSANKDDILDYAGALGSAYQGYQEGEREDELFKRNRAEFERLRPLRDAGMQGLMNTTRPDLSSMFVQEPARYRRVNVGSRV